jgi:hypothetical protein
LGRAHTPPNPDDPDGAAASRQGTAARGEREEEDEAVERRARVLFIKRAGTGAKDLTSRIAK